MRQIPVYIWSPEEEGQFQPGRCSRWWLRASLGSLEKELVAAGSRMLYFRGADARSVLAALAADVGAGAVLFNHLYDPISMVRRAGVRRGVSRLLPLARRRRCRPCCSRSGTITSGGYCLLRLFFISRMCLPPQVRDNEVKAYLAARGIFCRSYNADVLAEPWDLLDTSSSASDASAASNSTAGLHSAGLPQPFCTFDAFWAAHQGGPGGCPPPPLPAPPCLPPVPPVAGSLALDGLGITSPEEEMSNAQLSFHWRPGGAGAAATLESFMSGRLRAFDQDRAKTDRNSTSRLSPHVHYGEIRCEQLPLLTASCLAGGGCAALLPASRQRAAGCCR